MDLALAFPPSRQHLANVAQLAAANVSRGQLSRAGDPVVRISRGVYSDRPLPERGTYLLTNGLVDLGYLAEVRAVLLGTNQAIAGGRTAAVLWSFDLAVASRKGSSSWSRPAAPSSRRGSTSRS